MSEINAYYSSREQLRSKYTKDNLEELKNLVDSTIRNTYNYKVIKSVSMEPENYTFKLVYANSKDIPASIPSIESIIILSIKKLFNIDIQYLDSFTLADELRIVI